MDRVQSVVPTPVENEEDAENEEKWIVDLDTLFKEMEVKTDDRQGRKDRITHSQGRRENKVRKRKERRKD